MSGTGRRGLRRGAGDEADLLVDARSGQSGGRVRGEPARPEPRVEADDIGAPTGEIQNLRPTASDEDRWARRLYRSGPGFKLADPVVVTVEGDVRTLEERADDLQRLVEPVDAHRGRVVVDAEGSIVLFEPARTEPETDSAAGQRVRRGDRLGQDGRVVQVVHENEGHGVQTTRMGDRERHRGQRVHRPTVAVVLGDGDRVETEVLDAPQLLSSTAAGWRGAASVR